jgi:hypothetical protein
VAGGGNLKEKDSEVSNSRYQDLQSLTKQYGEETWRFYQEVKKLGPKIVEAFDEYLGGPKRAVSAVPPEGTFNPREVYRGAAFSSHGQGTIFLEPIAMGICTDIGNRGDRGSTWVRTVLEFRPAGNGILIAVGARATRVTVEGEIGRQMEPLCEAIYQDVREAFSLELDEALGRGRIGFLADNS